MLQPGNLAAWQPGAAGLLILDYYLFSLFLFLFHFDADFPGVFQDWP